VEFTVEEIAAQHEAAETLVSEAQRAAEALKRVPQIIQAILAEKEEFNRAIEAEKTSKNAAYDATLAGLGYSAKPKRVRRPSEVIALEKAARLEKKQEALDKLAQTITTQVQSGKGKKVAK
jgi:adenylosuccinate synthase